MNSSLPSNSVPEPASWSTLVTKYQTADTWQSVWQVVNTFIPFAVVWYLMYLSLSYSYWLTLLWRCQPPVCWFAFLSSNTIAGMDPFSTPGLLTTSLAPSVGLLP
ncbi:MAG: hypothetical protein HC875_26505 [Anaerolineales bacterium]|nr:hypothetical protein [Anaerolineales bacterium]